MVVFSIYEPLNFFSFISAIIAFNLMLIIMLITKKSKIMAKYSVFPFMLMLALCFLRMVLPFAIDNSWDFVISNETTPVLNKIINSIIDFCRYELFNILGLTVKVVHIMIFMLLAVALTLVLRYVIKCAKSNRQIKQIIARAERFERAEELFFEEEPKGKRANIKIYYSSEVEVPFLHGLFKGSIIMPKMNFADEELLSIIAHEWEHFKCGHMLIIILSNIVTCIMWWNPLVYFWKKNVLLALELYCDYNAITKNDGKNARAYVCGIAKVCSNGNPTESCADAQVSLINQECELETRLRVMLNYEKPTKREKIMNAAVCMVMILIFAASYMFGVTRIGRLPQNVDLEGAGDYESSFIAQSEEYLQENADGTFSLWVDGQCLITSKNINAKLFEHLKQADAIRYYE